MTVLRSSSSDWRSSAADTWPSGSAIRASELSMARRSFPLDMIIENISPSFKTCRRHGSAVRHDFQIDWLRHFQGRRIAQMSERRQSRADPLVELRIARRRDQLDIFDPAVRLDPDAHGHREFL